MPVTPSFPSFKAPRDILGRTPTHIYMLPHPALRQYVAHYTLSLPGAEDGPATLRLVPDASGCIVCTRRPGGMDAPFFWGPTSRCVDVDNDVNRTPLRVFIEFRPCGAHALLRGLPLAQVRDERLPLAALDPPLDRGLHLAVESRPLPVLPDDLDALLLARLGDVDDSPLMAELLGYMTLSGGGMRVAELVRRTRYSERHLRRVCGERLGLNLKSFARVLRINRACGLMGQTPPSLTAVAHQLGYYDQAHFIHEFRMVCGISPSEYLRSASVFYKEEFK